MIDTARAAVADTADIAADERDVGPCHRPAGRNSAAGPAGGDMGLRTPAGTDQAMVSREESGACTGVGTFRERSCTPKAATGQNRLPGHGRAPGGRAGPAPPTDGRTQRKPMDAA